MKDYYKVLGIGRDASAAQIKQAYRALVKACHPDLNPSPNAADWTRQLNEAHTALSDPETRLAHDLDLKLAESNTAKRAPGPGNRDQTRATPGPPPKVEPDLRCEHCGRIDASLRLSATWRVFSFLTYSKKSPRVKILCGGCRVKESLAANVTTAVTGWWSLWGFVWTLEALLKNSVGGDQPPDNNAALLRALGYQLYRAGCPREACKALRAALGLSPDPEAEKALNYLRSQVSPETPRRFWDRYKSLELHPLYYHVPVGAAGLVSSILALFAFSGASGPPSTESVPGAQLTSNHVNPPASRQKSEDLLGQVSVPSASNLPLRVDFRPVFSERELALPDQGELALSDRAFSYQGDTAPLKVMTKASDGNYVMKIVDWYSGEFVATYFIKSGGTLSIEVPLGVYKLKFASGEKWYGLKHLFGPTTVYSYVPDKLVFRISGDHAEGHRIELIPQVGGNLETRHMRPDEW